MPKSRRRTLGVQSLRGVGEAAVEERDIGVGALDLRGCQPD
ncbi:hypothetical protein ACGFZ9_42020 [Streptomyces mirabilis]